MPDPHDEGLACDLAALERTALGRRRLLSLGATGAMTALVAGCSRSTTPGASASGGASGTGPAGAPAGPPPQPDNGPVVTGTNADGVQCTAFTTETNGPYPADGTNQSRGATSNVLRSNGIARTDIRTDIGSQMMAPGLALDLTFTLVDVNQDCAPLAGYAVYVWHCDADGHYSLYDLPQHTWLRGLQTTDAKGQVRFRSIFPGAYTGRYPHIHFEVFSSQDKAIGGKYASLVSQLALPEKACEKVYALDTYAKSVRPWKQSKDIMDDNVFGDNGEARIEAMTLELDGSVQAGFEGMALIGLAR